jgi:hypothetical protein
MREKFRELKQGGTLEEKREFRERLKEKFQLGREKE